MYETIEALCKKGKIYPLTGKLPQKSTRVLITLLDDSGLPAVTPSAYKITKADVRKFTRSIQLKEPPLAFQKRIRNEW